MRIESALTSAREGLQSHGEAISVIGDNVANANTVGFKKQRIEFQDLFSEAEGSKASEPEGSAGTGIKTSTVRQIFDTGVIDNTGRQTDVAIAGNGFFTVGTVDDPAYTRAGNFTINEAGKLVTADGKPVLGFQGSSSTTLSELDMTAVPSGGQPSSSLAIYGNIDARSAATTVPANPASFSELSTLSSFAARNAEVYDSLGTRHNISIAFTKTDVNKWTAQAYIDGGEVTGGTAGTPTLLGTTTLNFAGNGVLAAADRAAATMKIAPAYSNGASAGSITVDLGGFTQFSASNIIQSVAQDGQGSGNIKSYEFKSNGDIYATLDSGSSTKVGQLALGDFANRDGLTRAGNSTLKPTTNSGTVIYNSATSTRKFGEVTGGALERSTVDIANEFVDLVTFQRGYQANSQTLTTASKLIEQTLGLIR